MRKLFSFCLFASLVLSSSAFAHMKRGGEFGQEQGQRRGHVMQQHQMSAGYSAPARYDVQGCWDIYFSADFLYWQAREENLAFALSTNNNNTNGSPPSDGKVFNPDFGWHPGVRVGLGVNLEHDDWDLFAVWTHLVVHDRTYLNRPEPDYLMMVLMHGGNDNLSPTRATANWRMIFNTVDLTLGRPFYLGRYLVFKPHTGLRGSWIEQTMDLKYDNITNIADTYLGNSVSSTDFDTWGLGPKFALDTEWMLGGGFSILADVATAILYTRYDAVKSETNETFGLLNFQNDTFLMVKNKTDSISPSLEGRLGFAWGTYFDRSNWHIDLSLAYEFHHWRDQNNIGLRVADQRGDLGLHRGTGNLSLHGGTFSCRLDF